MTSGPPTAADRTLNADVRWDDFDPHQYIGHNYLVMQAVDEEIITLVRDHFSDHFEGGDRVPRGIDVGAGPNLYPAFTMLPWCESITLLERSAQNRGYLLGQRDWYDAHWDPFWKVLCGRKGYADVDNPRERFKRVVQDPIAGSVFELGAAEPGWDVGTMFFVAESITTSLEEFQNAVRSFMHALKPGAPFATAFMEHSQGYRVGDIEFPARDIDKEDVRTALGDLVEPGVDIQRLNTSDLVRDGYTGMILARGRRKE
ncbi:MULTISPECIES: SCO2525 family SAM-dependent methyltransferase [Streptomyces]|uniref:Methyltransferase n=2 Tax=Streptomyces antibioticus TaxID=1890 RepID=A0AAE7CL80_STRAT|nr:MULTISPECIES: SCO2525 family SAM-dependent methyltransferase [Streptomyces]MCX4739287.1 SCO2525 family SAM-dependent methyltransferase [Streptomyces antibioticus]MCX5168930.1 SCO2525 family SAM-dependent methyltransferase [Streptomyces antibioticus]OOQ51925.1 methyltransferase [Streptomyces antibioticus]QIT44438.1 methyltransferase [Streptomyces antibioticus]SMF01916.1 NNMT/PNMT/TEMT family protein [Streptomyces sp. Amel2xC10]